MSLLRFECVVIAMNSASGSFQILCFGVYCHLRFSTWYFEYVCDLTMDESQELLIVPMGAVKRFISAFALAGSDFKDFIRLVPIICGISESYITPARAFQQGADLLMPRFLTSLVL